MPRLTRISRNGAEANARVHAKCCVPRSDRLLGMRTSIPSSLSSRAEGGARRGRVSGRWPRSHRATSGSAGSPPGLQARPPGCRTPSASPPEATDAAGASHLVRDARPALARSEGVRRRLSIRHGPDRGARNSILKVLGRRSGLMIPRNPFVGDWSALQNRGSRSSVGCLRRECFIPWTHRRNRGLVFPGPPAVQSLLHHPTRSCRFRQSPSAGPGGSKAAHCGRRRRRA